MDSAPFGAGFPHGAPFYSVKENEGLLADLVVEPGPGVCPVPVRCGHRDPQHLRCLGRIPAPPDGKPEGLVLLAEDEKRYRLLVTFDGAPEGGALRLTVAK